MESGNEDELQPYRSSDLPVEDGLGEQSEGNSCCSGLGRTFKSAMIAGAVVLGMANVALYASPSLSESIGAIVPDFLAKPAAMEGHDRGCGCHCASSCELPPSSEPVVSDT